MTLNFFSYIASTQFIELLSDILFERCSTSNILLSERRLIFWQRLTIKASHSFKRSFAMKDRQHWSSLFFFLWDCCIEALDIATWSCSLKTWHDHFVEAMVLFLTTCEFTCLWIEILMRTKTAEQRLTHRIRIYLVSINLNTWFAYVCRFLNITFMNNGFLCRNDWGTTKNIFSKFLQKDFICIRERMEIFFSVDLCGQMLARIVNVQPSFNKSISC